MKSLCLLNQLGQAPPHSTSVLSFFWTSHLRLNPLIFFWGQEKYQESVCAAQVTGDSYITTGRTELTAEGYNTAFMSGFCTASQQHSIEALYKTRSGKTATNFPGVFRILLFRWFNSAWFEFHFDNSSTP